MHQRGGRKGGRGAKAGAKCRVPVAMGKPTDWFASTALTGKSSCKVRQGREGDALLRDPDWAVRREPRPPAMALATLPHGQHGPFRRCGFPAAPRKGRAMGQKGRKEGREGWTGEDGRQSGRRFAECGTEKRQPGLILSIMVDEF